MRDFARVLLSATAVLGMVGATTLLPSTAAVSAVAQDDEPPPVVEDYTYPGAAAILAQRGIKLIKGNGGIQYADCASGGGQVKVESRTKGAVCFTVKPEGGFLTLEIPEVYLIWSTNRHSTKATFTVAGQISTVDIPKNDFRGIGEGSGGPDPATVLEIRVAPA